MTDQQVEHSVSKLGNGSYEFIVRLPNYDSQAAVSCTSSLYRVLTSLNDIDSLVLDGIHGYRRK